MAVFHFAVVTPLVVLLLGASVPGSDFLASVFAIWFLLAMGLVWLVWGGLTLWRKQRNLPALVSLRTFLVGPLAVTIAAGLLLADVPLQARWASSKGAFEQVVSTAPPPVPKTEREKFSTASRVGLFNLWSAERVGDGILFREKTGDFVNDAGFAYLPTGPFPELENGSFERPQFEPLGDGWYTWTASW